MPRRAGRLALAAALFLVVAPLSGGRAEGRLPGLPLALLGTSEGLWALTCDGPCTGEGRQNAGRVLRLDARDGHVVGQARLPRTDALAVGPAGLYLTDFRHDRVRRLDSRTLRVASVLTLRLPFRFAPRDNAFLPIAVAVGSSGLWIATARCALAHADVLARRVVATVRLPCDAHGGLALASGGVWVGESLLGVYRVDPRTHRVVWRRRIGPADGRLAVDELVAGGGRLLAIGTWTKGDVATERRGLARVDPRRNRLEGVTELPSGPLASAFARGSLWVGRVGGTEIERIDARTGRVSARLPFRVGTVLAVAGDRLWTADRDGALRSRDLR